ncbi:MAG: TerC family protein [Alphaproteobacteria bacterium]|nr:TerC family protein [Alphaproteobacteria bacterium]
MSEVTSVFWFGFAVFLAIAISIDLGVTKKRDKEISFKDALMRVCIWVMCAVIFGVGIGHYLGSQKALEFFTGYLIELSLSLDNVFIIALIFTHFAVPMRFQHRVLFWGIIGALVMRFGMIMVGSALVKEFAWIMYIFGAFLVFTGIKLVLQKHDAFNPEENKLVKLARKLFPVTETMEGNRFFVKRDGKRFATPLFIVLILVEVTDLVFAVDSVPAIFAVTLDPFIVFTANAFAILGLRSMYFLLAGLIPKFYYLKLGLSALLVFVGSKMLMVEYYHIPTAISLMVILGILLTALIASVVRSRKLRELP